jgi:hypothetical protein
MNTSERTKQWAAQQFGIKPEEVAWYNSGSCYDRIGVTTKEAAEKVQEAVKGETANGGMLDGMPLGGFSQGPDGIYDVHC